MMKWQTLRRRSYLMVVAVLAITFMAGTLTSTTYAKFRGPDVKAKNFSATYVGVTDPLDSMEPGMSELVLTQVNGRFVGGKRSQMVVDLLNAGAFGGIQLLSNRDCDGPEPGTDLGWCIHGRAQDWALMPQPLLPTVSVNGDTVMWGPGFVKQVVDGEGYEGVATYRVTLRKPNDPAIEGLVVTINVDGFVSKVHKPVARHHAQDKTHEDDEDKESSDD